jgi:tRNA(fMet)-specific endonuclease VapC
MVVLDTDHASELGFRSAAGVRLLLRLETSGVDAVVTAITVEEQMRGWLAEIRRRVNPADQVAAYDRLVRQVELLASWVILPWDMAAVEWLRRLREQRIRIGTQDLKIASIALAYDATLLTRNIQDFAQVPGLKIENWLD